MHNICVAEFFKIELIKNRYCKYISPIPQFSPVVKHPGFLGYALYRCFKPLFVFGICFG